MWKGIPSKKENEKEFLQGILYGGVPEKGTKKGMHILAYVPIPFVKEMCEKKCCSVTALPLRCCAALSIHKSQGMTGGPGQSFEKVIIYYYAEPGTRSNTIGLELVASSRAMNIECLAIGNPVQELTYKYIESIGNTPAYAKQKLFLHDIEQKSVGSQQITKERINALDPATNKTYEGGAEFLLNRYYALLEQRISPNSQVL